MKSSKLALVVVILALSMDGVAQEYAFKVLVNKGKNELKSGASWQQIKVGSSLKAADELRVAENSYIGLVHVTGKPLELKQSGNYKVTDLAARVSGGASVLNKYTDFILSSNTGPRSNLAATGAVDRGVDNIKVYLPRTELAVVYGNNVTISWENDQSLKPYEVVFKSMFGDELSSLETSSNSIVVNLNDRNFENEDNIIVTVYSKSNRSKASDEYTLKKLSKADRERIKSAYSEIATQTAEQTAFNKFLIAGFYEQNNLLIDAMPYYQEAIKLAPDVQYYKDTYEEFLVRNGIKKPGPKK
jgi:hypothetical protein